MRTSVCIVLSMLWNCGSKTGNYPADDIRSSETSESLAIYCPDNLSCLMPCCLVILAVSQAEVTQWCKGKTKQTMSIMFRIPLWIAAVFIDSWFHLLCIFILFCLSKLIFCYASVFYLLPSSPPLPSIWALHLAIIFVQKSETSLVFGQIIIVMHLDLKYSMFTVKLG